MKDIFCKSTTCVREEHTHQNEDYCIFALRQCQSLPLATSEKTQIKSKEKLATKLV